MDAFSAIAEPTRRSILEILAREGELSSSDIANRFTVTPSAISQHLKILYESQLIRLEKRAQQRIYDVNPVAMRGLEDWAKQMNAHLDKLESQLK